MHGGELLHPNVLEDAEHRDLAGLIDEGVVGGDGEIQMHDLFLGERNRELRPVPRHPQDAARALRVHAHGELFDGLRD